MKPVIGITMSPSTDSDHERRGNLSHFYMDAVRAAGGVPVMLFDGEDEAEHLAERLDGLLLSGGDDIEPALFGEENIDSRGVDARRDALETACLQAFALRDKPVLGICRGIQLMAAALGGTLWQDVPKQMSVPHVYGENHEILVRESTFLSPLLPARITVNSTHHQAVRALPPRFMACAVAPDGVIEAMEAADGRRLYGVQFHPERLFQQERMLGIFRLLTK